MAYEERYGQVQRPKYDCLLFDLDDTLYPLSSGLAAACGKNIADYMVEKLGIEPDKISALGNLLYKNYGTTMAGLRAIGYNFDYDEYHSFVHGRLPYENLKPDPVLRTLLLSLPYRKIVRAIWPFISCLDYILFRFAKTFLIYALLHNRSLPMLISFVHGRLPYENLKPDPVLRTLLLSLPYRKIIFTNADKVHSLKVLSILGLEDCFEGIICFETLNPTHKTEFLGSNAPIRSSEIFDIIGHFLEPNNVGSVLPKTPILCKPSEAAIEKALEIAKIDPHRTLFFEDSVRNIQAGKRVGLHTVLVGKSQRVQGADYALGSIHNLKEAVPELWETDKVAGVGYAGVFVPTLVTA